MPDSYGESYDDVKLSEHRRKWRQTREEQLLMLRIPLAGCYTDLDSDDKGRKQQNEGFVEKYGGNPTVHHQRIDESAQLFECIKSYLQFDCRKTCLATIVFNGHGSKGGLLIHNGACIPLDDIVNFVNYSLDAIEGIPLMPRAVDIVFAQTYGHMHSYRENPGDRINVISLTSDVKTATMTLHKKGSSSIESTHPELELYAQRRRMQKIDPELECLHGVTGSYT